VALTIDRPTGTPARPCPQPHSRELRTRTGRITPAALLPAGLVSAILVAAPFAGTTTHALSADSRPAAVATATAAGAPVADAPASRVPASTDAPASGLPAAGAQDAVQTGAPAGAPGTSTTGSQNADHGFSLSVPQASVRNLVIAYLLITILGAAVIIIAAIRGAHRHE
jgi:hypothetical protein